MTSGYRETDSLQAIEEILIEPALNLMRAEWKSGCTGRNLAPILSAIEALKSRAPATQTVTVLEAIRGSFSSFLASNQTERQELLKSTAERLKAVAPLLREDSPPFGPIGINPSALHSVKRTPAKSGLPSRRPDEPVTTLAGVGPAVAGKLAQLGISTIGDLLAHVPRTHIDFSRPQRIGDVGQIWNQDAVTLSGTVTEITTIQMGRKRVEARITDGTGWARITSFNPYIGKQISHGDEIVVHGVVDASRGGLSLTGPEWERRDSPDLQRTRLIPVYPLTQGLGQKQLRRMTRLAIDATQRTLPDYVPANILSANNLIGLPHAIAQRHYPANREMLADATRRMAFDDLFLLQIGLAQRKAANSEKAGNDLTEGLALAREFLATLPFPLTSAQRLAIRDVSSDLTGSRVMQRLVQGDVGSGKTVVAAAAAIQAVGAGFQAAVMAPTEILANQLFLTFNTLFKQMGEAAPEISLLTGTTKKRERVLLHERLVAGEIDILVGTHAVIQQGVLFNRLGLSVVDEQHRFGVRQRGELPSKATVGPAHVLTMSATPIPRSLNLVLMGDIDVSVIDEMPPGREPVTTRRFFGEQRVRAYNRVRAEVAEGRQAFVICPLVEDSDLSDAKSAVAEAERLQRDVFPDLRVSVLHGRMSGGEKDRIMASFKAREFDILVATSVIEVGIDVPNATVMMVEGADRFGLAQLHQFRGRVGRGGGASYCLLLADDASPMAEERLRMLESTTDGFVLAEADLRMRGPGDFLGTRQSGLPELSMLRTGFDSRLLDIARKAAFDLVAQDPALEQPDHLPLRKQVLSFWSSAARELAGA